MEQRIVGSHPISGATVRTPDLINASFSFLIVRLIQSTSRPPKINDPTHLARLSLAHSAPMRYSRFGCAAPRILEETDRRCAFPFAVPSRLLLLLPTPSTFPSSHLPRKDNAQPCPLEFTLESSPLMSVAATSRTSSVTTA